MAKRVVLIKHEGSPRDDRAATWLARQGFELDWRAPYASDGLEAPDDGVAGTVLYGGLQGIPEIGRHPFLAEEARWVERCLRPGIQTREEQDAHAAAHDQAQHDWFVGFLEGLFVQPDGEV